MSCTCRWGEALVGAAASPLPRANPQGKLAMSKLHLVFGGRVSDPQGLDFVDLSNLDVVGLYPDYKSAEKAWRSAAQRTVDDEIGRANDRTPGTNAPLVFRSLL